MSFDSFASDERTFDAVMRNLEITGEAARQIREDLKARYPKVEWRGIIGFRDVAIHAYPTIDEEVVWDIFRTKVPDLLSQVESMLNELPDESST
jgi:uncharacterized protein with HEPN domain